MSRQISFSICGVHKHHDSLRSRCTDTPASISVTCSTRTLSVVANKAADDDSVHLCTQISEILKPLRRAVHNGASERKFLHQHKSMSDFRETFAVSSPNTQLTKTVEIGREIARN